MISIIRLGVLMMVLGGCSILVMRGVEPGRNVEQEPDCSESHAPMYIDGLTASVAAKLAVEFARMDPPAPPSLVVGTVITSLLFTASTYAGASRYKECRKARAEWHALQAINETGASSDDEPAGTSGYFCTSSPSRTDLYPCVRERATCEQVRKSLALPDSEGCAPRDIAWCFDIHRTPRCSGTQYACEEQGAASAAPRACTKRP